MQFARPVSRQARRYYPSNQRPQTFDYAAEKARWTDPHVRTFAVSELYNKIEAPLSECEDIMSTWRETKWFNRGDDNKKLRDRVNSFLSEKYDHGLEQNFLHRLLIQYSLISHGSFDKAFHGYFRKANGVTTYDLDPRWDTVRSLLFTNVTVIDDLYHLSGMGGAGYRSALGRMLSTSLEHAIPTGKSNVSEFAKIMFQHRSDREGPVVPPRMLASHSESEGVDFVLTLPHATDASRHQLALVIIGSENKYRRRVQVPDEVRRAHMAARAEKVFGLAPGDIETTVLLTPPWMLDRHSLLKCHTLVGGLSPLYSDWLPYYHYELTQHDPDWAYQAKKDAEDEFYQL
eukprot:TRINITY_DN58026_c0_g1_i1.p1 TRINITY_DN58026_c0_g1~~TRINITY_DN58026_c0_g1_i1.p1  ORF type:complete len:345 (+),score=92.30 TRINITY_DN58026_c0_g1_i1:223-1257(+)